MLVSVLLLYLSTKVERITNNFDLPLTALQNGEEKENEKRKNSEKNKDIKLK